MEKVLLLFTNFKGDFWNNKREVTYKKEYFDADILNDLTKKCPLPALGIFKHEGEINNSFTYLKINGIRFDKEHIIFDFEPIAKAKIKSNNLIDILPSENTRLLSSIIDYEKINDILQRIGEPHPKEWINAKKLNTLITDWNDFIGKYFLDLKNNSLSNEEFEDRIYSLLTALGFDVEQKGHTLKGEYADGVAFLSENKEYMIVYDCKNISNFFPTSGDIRAIKTYVEDEKKVYNIENKFCVFIAKSFKQEQTKNIFYFTVDSLLYLLYKRLRFGLFGLNPLKKILDKNLSLDKQMIDNEWRDKII